MSSDEVADYLKARDYSIECLSYVWNKSKPQIETLISEHETSLSTSGVGFITDAFDMLSDGTVAIGGPVMADGTDNQVIASTGVAGAAQIGYALEAATDGETFQVLVNIGGSGAIA